jgi:hypothetical protein
MTHYPPRIGWKVLPFALLSLLCSFNTQAGVYRRPEPVQIRPLVLNPVFLPTKLADTFHMTPMMYYGDDYLKPGEFDFDMAIGTFGTDFHKSGNLISVKEDSKIGVYHDLAWRFGLLSEVGSLHLPVELFTELPLFYHAGEISSYRRNAPNLNAPFVFVDQVGNDDVAVGKWIWGLRFGLLPESRILPSLNLEGSVGLPVSHELASEGTDFDLKLSCEKYFGLGITGNLYGGFLFPGEGQEVFTDVGVDEENYVMYYGLMTDTNLAQLCGASQPGRTWFHLGASWRDALYDFGWEGPDYAKEEVKISSGISFDMGYWGRKIGCPQGMVGVVYTAHGGPEEDEVQLITRFNFPYEFDR